MSIDALVEISRYYGGNPAYVLAGGGNTSYKKGDTLFVKASGHALAEASAESFVEMDRKALSQIVRKSYPQPAEDDPNGGKRESAVLADMMAAKKNAGDGKRPSVEALLHDLLPFPFVVHLHPALVNGVTCARQGEAAVGEIFPGGAIWIPISNPGYTLTIRVKKAMDAYQEKYRKPASVIFLQNHGVFVSAETTDGIREQYGEIMSKIAGRIKREPDFFGEERITNKTTEYTETHGEEKELSPRRQDAEDAKPIPDNSFAPLRLCEMKFEVMQILKELAGAAAFINNREISSFVKDRASFAPVSSAFTPDHIVYSGSDPLFVDIGADIRDAPQIKARLLEAWKSHIAKTGRNAKTIAVQGLGVFGAAATEKAADLALDLFKDTVKVAVYAESFGGPLFMTADEIGFINNWEVERFRSAVSTK